MKVKYFGHASFLFTSASGVRVITDPYGVTNDLTYGKIEEAADAVLVSHDHFDHNEIRSIRGRPSVLKEQGVANVKGITFAAIPTFHDEAEGRKRGNNLVFCFEMDGVRVCHLGDLGHLLNDGDIAAIGLVDVLCVPVGGYYTIDAREATAVCTSLSPKVILPMHYKTAKCGFPITGVEDFLTGKTVVRRIEGSEIEFMAGSLPAGTDVVVLKPAL
jgi:L-ascorbate metabolism protein UlaG (beta-lactamase superfamily)